MSSSPWGAVQHSKQIVRGVREVSTAGHGGIMISKVFAEKNLSESALKRADAYGNYYCYEEDCAWAIPMLEIKQYWNMYWSKNTDMESKEKSIVQTLSLYYPDYLLEKGIAPVEPEYTYYKEGQLRDKLHEEKSPDLIVCAWGTWKTNKSGVILVSTADKKLYHIKEDGYSDLRLKLLSKCEVIEEVKEMY